MLNLNQKTIQGKLKFEGIGLHNGKKVKMTLIPAPPNSGIKFKRVDLKNNNFINAIYLNVKDPLLCTIIENQHNVRVSTIEHLMGALYGEKIDNLLIEIDSDEVPILDGSAKDFVSKLREVGVKNYDTPKKYIKILKKFEFREKEKFISIEPCENNLIIDFEIIYKNLFIGSQRQILDFNKDNLEQIYNSRTFCLYEDVDKIRQMGLAKGGSLDNAVVVQGDKVLNDNGTRHNNEFVMHKILDCLGDLMLSKYNIIGKIKCSQGGHKLTNDFLRELFLDKSNFSTIQFKETKLPNIIIDNESLAVPA